MTHPNPVQPNEGLPRAFGKYTLLSRIATGGMAHVYLALQQGEFGVEKLVVVKTLLPALANREQFVEMFLNEARLAATLTHPNVAEVFDAGEIGGLYFMAMEFIEGQDLRRLQRWRRQQGKAAIPLEYALLITTKALSGLGYAHQKTDFNGTPLNLVHCDISPQNILITFDGNVKLVDFGVAKSASHLEEAGAGQIKGKLAYMSPEQARGEAIDARTDLFALSTVLYEMTTGLRLFRGANDAETLRNIRSGQYTPATQVRPGYPGQLEAILARGLSLDRDQRYPNARAMQSDLQNYANSAGLAVSEGQFADWLGNELAVLREQQQRIIRQVRALAAQAGDSQPVSQPRISRPSAAGIHLSPQGLGDDEGSSSADNQATLDGAAHSVRPGRDGGRRRFIFALSATTLLALVAFAGLSGSVTIDGIKDRSKALIAELTGSEPAGAATDSEGDMIEIEFQITPGNAAVWLDGDLLQSDRATVSRGEPHEVRISAPGYGERLFEFTPKENGQIVRIGIDDEPIEAER